MMEEINLSMETKEAKNKDRESKVQKQSVPSSITKRFKQSKRYERTHQKNLQYRYKLRQRIALLLVAILTSAIKMYRKHYP